MDNSFKMSHDQDEIWMAEALFLAQMAADKNEVPVGALIVRENSIIGRGYNQRESQSCVTAHAEIIALKEACQTLKSWRLPGCKLYVTLEPCLMCAGAIYQARIEAVIFGVFDPKAGSLGSLYKIHEDSRLNHRFMVKEGVLEEESRRLLKDFFKNRRQMER